MAWVIKFHRKKLKLSNKKHLFESSLVRDQLSPKKHGFIDLIEDHPFEIMLSIALMFFGVRALITGLASVPNAVQLLPLALSITYCVLSMFGGGLVVFGLAARYRFDWSYGAERAGLFISASAWGSYVIGFFFTSLTPSATLFILALLALSGGCLIRARVINKNAKATLDALRQANHDREET